MSQPKFASFSRDGKPGYGLLVGDGIIDLSARHGAKWPTLREVVVDGALLDIAKEAAGVQPRLSGVGNPL